MPTYRYRLVADIEVDAPNIMTAEKAVRVIDHHSTIPRVRGLGSYIGGVRLPSMQKNERCPVEIKVGFGTIERAKKCGT